MMLVLGLVLAVTACSTDFLADRQIEETSAWKRDGLTVTVIFHCEIVDQAAQRTGVTVKVTNPEADGTTVKITFLATTNTRTGRGPDHWEPDTELQSSKDVALFFQPATDGVAYGIAVYKDGKKIASTRLYAKGDENCRDDDR